MVRRAGFAGPLYQNRSPLSLKKHMKIYTKNGDKGLTALFGGKKLPKSHQIFEILGTLDELNCYLGIAAVGAPRDLCELLEVIQRDLFELGASYSMIYKQPLNKKILSKRCMYCEQQIDRLEKSLQRLTNFILPGGSAVSGYLHLARAVCHRLERAMVQLSETESLEIGASIPYINRLSDLLFVMARTANYAFNVPDCLWLPSARPSKL